MAKVQILPGRVANQIAAGEVIERPAAVVKELVENALDAGARRIAVEFAHAGRSLIRVEDDGEGMEPDDARLALERHATSKIASASDLDRLATYGFRGEALPSIASVSRFTLRTRRRGAESGTEIVVNAGKGLRERACGCPVGTRIDVEHLFEPVPARRKFLKSDRTESAHIVSCVRLYALACPSVAFSLSEDGRAAFQSPNRPALADRVAEIFGRRAAEELIDLDSSEPGLRLSGLVGRPGVGRASRHDLVVFVNGRPVDSRALNGALMESYRESLPQGRYPVAFVFLECDPAEVDVNVHPAKREVRFRREAVIRGFVIRSVLSRLRQSSNPPATVAAPLAPLGSPGPLPAPIGGWTGEPAQAAFVATPPATAGPSIAPSPSPGWRYLGTAHGNYILFETSQGLVLLDRKAAHQRIWYERLMAQFASGGVPVQRLLFSISIELAPVVSAILADHLAFFGTHGFEIAEFGRHFFRVDAVPAWLEPGDADGFIRDLLAVIRDGRTSASKDPLARDALARLAADKAVRLPPASGEGQALVLLRELFGTSAPVSSPAGRPTYVELNHGELARRFQK